MGQIDPNVDFQGFLREAVQEEVAKSKTGGGNPAAEPIELNIGGQTYRYENKADMEAKLNNFMCAVSTQLQDLQTKVNAAGVAPTNEGSFVSGNETQDWNESND